MKLTLDVKPFSFQLVKELKSSKGLITRKSGWLLHLESTYGESGWGEISPMNSYDLYQCQEVLNKVGSEPKRETLERCIEDLSGAIGFGFGSGVGVWVGVG